jgi:hypothetical protein
VSKPNAGGAPRGTERTLNAMRYLGLVRDNGGQDSGKNIVLHFDSKASTLARLQT